MIFSGFDNELTSALGSRKVSTSETFDNHVGGRDAYPDCDRVRVPADRVAGLWYDQGGQEGRHARRRPDRDGGTGRHHVQG